MSTIPASCASATVVRNESSPARCRKMSRSRSDSLFSPVNLRPNFFDPVDERFAADPVVAMLTLKNGGLAPQTRFRQPGANRQ